MDNKVNHFLVKVSDGVTLDNVVAAAKTNKDKIFFTPTGKIVVAGIGTDTDGKAKVIQYGVDNTQYGKVSAKLKDFIDGSIAGQPTVKDYVDGTTIKAVNDLCDSLVTSDSDFFTYDERAGFKNALSIKYVTATPDVPAHIALFAKGGETELSSINISDIVGNGVLESSAYDKTSGELTLNFKNGSSNGITPVTINLKEFLDVDDIVVSDDSTEYLTTNKPETTTDEKQLTVGVTKKVQDAVAAAETALQKTTVSAGDDTTKNYVTLSETAISDKHEASQTLTLNVASDLATVNETDKKLADAAAVKKYTDDAVAAKNVAAEGDTYVNASANANTVTVTATDLTKKSLGLADTSIQEITTTYIGAADGTSADIVKLGGSIADKAEGGKTVELNLSLTKGEVKTADDFGVTTYGFATAGNIHDFVMAYVAHALDNYNPWTTYTGE